MAKKTELFFWIVSCEGHTDAWVNAADWEQATVAAAAFWDVPWKTVAAYCTYTRKTRAIKGVCPKCGRTLFGGAELCGVCRRVLEDEERNLRQYLKNRYYHKKRV